MPRGQFITFEGLDGSGKTTQIRKLAGWLEKRGHASLVTRQPGGTPTGDRIREILLDARNAGLAPTAEMALMFADRAQAINQVIQPALDDGKIVLCDPDGRLWNDSGKRMYAAAPRSAPARWYAYHDHEGATGLDAAH